jgi:hypothetical protein
MAEDARTIESIKATLLRLNALAVTQGKQEIVEPAKIHAEFARMSQEGECAPLVLACNYALSSEMVPAAHRKPMDAYAAGLLGQLCREETVGALFIDYVTHLQQRLVEPNSTEAVEYKSAIDGAEAAEMRRTFVTPPFAL